MKTHKWLRHVGIRTRLSVRSAPGNSSTGTVRAWAVRGIVILALALGSLGAVAAASSSHGSPINSGDFISTPWMY
jgi:hypothetical protein